MTTEKPRISVLDPLDPAISLARRILLEPFDLGKWLIIGFCAWLAYLGNPGSGINIRGGGPLRLQVRSDDLLGEMEETFYHTKEFVSQNLPWIIPAVFVGVLLFLALWLLVTWLSSHGRFMFLHCITLNRAEVRTPWMRWRQQANSLFLFRVVLSFIGFAVAGLPCIVAFFLIAMGASTRTPDRLGIFIVAVTVLCVALVLWIALAVLQKLTADFVVPIMCLRTAKCSAAWQEFVTLLTANAGSFLLYLLFQIAIKVAILSVLVVAGCATCGCACCFTAIPYIGTVVVLPLLVFERAYSLHYFRQFGSEYDVFDMKAETAPVG